MRCVTLRRVVFLLCLKMTVDIPGTDCLTYDEEQLPANRYSVAGPNALARSVLLDRQERLQLNCDDIMDRDDQDDQDDQDNAEPQMFHHLIVDEQHKLLYCYVPKVACTNWKRVLMMSMGIWSGETRDPLEIPASLAHSVGVFRTLSNYTYQEIEDKLATYNKLIVVRHPFERLLSAYRNKFESKHNSSAYFQDRFGKRIVKKYRENATREALEKGDDVTFGEFVDFVVDDNENGTRNEHWRPITELCHPCLVNYDIISKYESLVEDATEVLERMGVSGIRFPNKPPSTESTFQRLGKYYSNLSLKQLQKLTKLYRLDFKVFDYTLEDVLGFSLA